MPDSLYDATALTAVSIQHSNRNMGYIGGLCAPTIRASKQTGTIWRLDAKQAHRQVGDSKRSPGAYAHRIDFDVDKDLTYRATDHAFDAIVTDEERDQADSVLQPKINKTQFITEVLMLEREKAVYDAFIAAITGAEANAIAIGSEWDNKVNGDPIKDLNDGITEVKALNGVKPNAVAMDEKVLRAIMHHPDFQERAKYTGGPGTVTGTLDVAAGLLGQMIGIPTILYADVGMINTAAKDATAVLSEVWSDDVVMFYRQMNPGFSTANSLVTVVWNGVSAGAENGLRVFTFRDDRGKFDGVQADWYYEVKALGDSAAKINAVRWSNALAA